MTSTLTWPEVAFLAVWVVMLLGILAILMWDSHR